MITYKRVVDSVVELLRKAETELSEDVLRALKKAYEEEENEIARMNLKAILENIEYAKRMGVPICQDTGLPIFFVEIGRELFLDFNLKDAIVQGVIRATEEVPLRPNVVHPLTRENTGNNVGIHMPEINVDIVEGDKLKISVIPKGAGSENCSVLKMLSPSEVNKVKRVVVEAVRNAMGKPCPPVFVGVGIGPSFDGCARLAKKALLRDVTDMNDFEIEILNCINRLGIGPMGLGGKFTALAVLIEIGYCHTASLPIAVNIQCWANRKASIVLD